VIEAAALGTPAIVSDLPALREIAPPGALFLDPTDGPGWRRAILARAGAT
jgi:glycosyltransferase involved in cell wall biosynthesis